MLLRALIGWLGLVVLANLNAGAREKWVAPRWGAYAGHVISTATFCPMIFAVAWLSIRWMGPATTGDAWRIGALWVTLTVAFEFLAGHYVFRNSWAKLFADHNVFQGRVWILVLISCLIAPVWAAGKSSGAVGRTRPPAGQARPAATETPVVAWQTPLIDVVATKTILDGGRVGYSYNVTNGSAIPLTAIEVGYDLQSLAGQLMTLPIGASVDSIPPSCYTSPRGWEFRILAREEEPWIYLDWTSTAASYDLLGGDSLGGFSVTLPEADSLYETCSWTAYMANGEEYGGAITRSHGR